VYGPGIGRSNYQSLAEFDQAVRARYQTFYNQADTIAQARIAAGQLENDPTIVGAFMDRFARGQMRAWLASEGIQEGPGSLIQVNRWLRDPAGTGAYRIPDIRIPGADTIYDGTIAPKGWDTMQIRTFSIFARESNIVIVRPDRLGGSYAIWPY
jgi:hypothetical protein